MKLKDWIERQEADARRAVEVARLARTMLSCLEDSETFSSAYLNSYFTVPRFTLYLSDLKKSDEAVKEVMRKFGVKTLRRNFDETDGKIIYSWSVKFGTYSADFEMKVESSRCKIVPVEERVWVPPTEGRYETKKRFIIANPEECFGGKPITDDGGSDDDAKQTETLPSF
jgi:hypothetical protein